MERKDLKTMREFHPRLLGPIFLLPVLLAAAPAWAQFGDAPAGQFGQQPGDQFGGPFGVPMEQSYGGLGNELAPGFGEPLVSVRAEFTVAVSDKPARLFVTAVVKPGWHIYSIAQASGGPVRTEINVEDSQAYRVVGDFRAVTPPEKNPEPVYHNLIVETHSGTAVWYAPIELTAGVDPATLRIRGSVYAQGCDSVSKQCRAPENHAFVAFAGSGIDVPEAEPGAEPAPPAIRPVGMGTLAGALVIAFFGGVVLNLMPCVLPVLSLKLVSFMKQSGQSRAHVLALNCWYSAGLLAVFLTLAALSVFSSQILGIDQLAWGQQYTFATFKIAIAALVFVLALSFLGVWEIPIPGFVGSGTAAKLQTQEGATGAFFMGVFTTILATPCTGPGLGYVFGLTFGQPAYVTYLVFGTVGLGMASPYLTIGAFPGLIRFLPKPGEWMETLKQSMAFLLLATVVYLFTTMSEEYFIPTLTLLFGLWFACWLIGRTPITADLGQKLTSWGSGLAVAALVGFFAFNFLLHDSEFPWQPFSPRALQEARAEGKTVMVDFAADWCPNCKFNTYTAIDTDDVRRLVEENGVVPLLADWTNPNAEIKEALNGLGYNSIPVLAIWPAGKETPIILADLLRESQVLKALQEAGPSKATTKTPEVGK